MNPVRTMISLYRSIDFEINLSCDYLACRFSVEIMLYVFYWFLYYNIVCAEYWFWCSPLLYFLKLPFLICTSLFLQTLFVAVIFNPRSCVTLILLLLLLLLLLVFSQATGMALVRCILGKFLGLACHWFPPLFRYSHFSPPDVSTSATTWEIPAAEVGTVGENVVR